MSFGDWVMGRKKLDVSYGDATEGDMTFWKDRYGKLSDLNCGTWTDFEVGERIMRTSDRSRSLQSARYAARDRIMHLSVRVFYLEKELAAAAAAAPARETDQKPIGYVRADELGKFKRTPAGERGMMLYKAPIKAGVALYAGPMPAPEIDEQEEFEKWAGPNGYSLGRIQTGFRKGQYINQSTRDVHAAFQAAIAVIKAATEEGTGK